MKKVKNQSMIISQMQRCICQFDVAREHHRRCNRLHFICLDIRNNIAILHSDEFGDGEFKVLIGCLLISEAYFSESQREVLKSRILAFLERI